MPKSTTPENGVEQTIEFSLQDDIGITLEELQVLVAQEGFFDIWVGEYASDRSTLEEYRRGVQIRTNRLLTAMGLDLATWQEAIVDADGSGNFYWLDKSNHARERIRVAGYPSPGECICHMAYYGLDIEGDEAGGCSIRLDFELPSGLVASLTSSSDFWTEREDITDEDDEQKEFISVEFNVEIELRITSQNRLGT